MTRRLYIVSIAYLQDGQRKHEATWLWGESDWDMELYVRPKVAHLHQPTAGWPYASIIIRPTPVVATVGDGDVWVDTELTGNQPEFTELATKFASMEREECTSA